MAKNTSRPARWAQACAEAKAGLEELRSLQEEYEEWRDNLPENLQSGTLYDKLDEICNIDIESAISSVDEAENADLPQGFGRD